MCPKRFKSALFDQFLVTHSSVYLITGPLYVLMKSYKQALPPLLHVRIHKLWTPELFVECYFVARKNPIRCKGNKPQAVTVIGFTACIFFLL